MKIKTLNIKNYKNLDAELRHDSDLIAFIGNNGSGKSNLLEAISLIFRSLYVSTYKVNFDYSIKYSFEEKLVEIKQVSKKKSFLVDEKEVKDMVL